jgi:uncharacterized cupin superfamily protein
MSIVERDDVPARATPQDGLRASWQNLGRAVGSVRVGLRRIRVEPGQRSTPCHAHAAEEEIFYVLAGSALLWQDGATTAVAAGDCIVHVAGPASHTLRAGDDGLDVLAFGERRTAELCLLERTGWAWLGDDWVQAGGGQSPWEREAALPEPPFPEPGERPANVVNVDAVDGFSVDRPRFGATARMLGRRAGSLTTGLNHVVVAPGKLNCPEHCHSAEEELFVVLDGEGTLLLGDAELPVKAGSVVSRPAGTRVAHAFRAGEGPLTMLAYGQRDTNDVCFYPRSNKIMWRGIGVIGRIERLDYWDGED